MNNVVELNHPLITSLLAKLRDERTNTKDFRETIREIGKYLCYESIKDLELKKVKINTPLQEYETGIIDENEIVCIPILRAGLGILDGVLSVIPNASVGHIGMYRDEKTFKPVNYFFKVPRKIEEKTVLLLDPMLATGGSAIDAVNLLKENGVKKIKFLCIIAAPEGVEKLKNTHPDIQIYCSCIDERLNENKYICPGLGDAGDRIFGTIE